MKTIDVPEKARELTLIVSLSGGKDSTATALALREASLPFRLAFADTGWEAPETYAHLETLERHLGPSDFFYLAATASAGAAAAIDDIEAGRAPAAVVASRPHIERVVGAVRGVADELLAAMETERAAQSAPDEEEAKL